MVEQGAQGALEKAILHIASGGLWALRRTGRQSCAHVQSRGRGGPDRSRSIASTYWAEPKARLVAEGAALGRATPKSTISICGSSRVHQEGHRSPRVIAENFTVLFHTNKKIND